jgi:2-(1,2-epoxy-1,2-dihydrophenyl)acetyl-CoA isomerase
LEPAVIIEKKGAVSIIRMNLPNKLNCLEPIFRDDFKSCLRQFDEDPQSPVAILTGKGRAFCAGGDLEELKDGMTAVHGVRHMKGCNEIIGMIAGITKPIIAAVNGPAAGAGFSIAMACDIVIASTAASFMQAFTKVGLVPDMGSLYFLPRVIGMHRAKELMWTARRIKAEEAMEIGILNRLVSPETLESEALSLAEDLAAGPAFAIGLSKMLLSRSLENTLQDMMQYEGLAQAICMQSMDHQEGVKAFYEKRKALFVGK